MSRTVSIRSRVMPHQLYYEEDEESLQHELAQATQKLHETIEKMDKIKGERKLKTEEIWEVHDASAEVSKIQRKMTKIEKKNMSLKAKK